MDSYTITVISSYASFTVGAKRPLLLNAPLKGWGKPSIRTSGFVNSGSDGGDDTEQYYGKREIPLSFDLIAGSCEEHDDMRRTIDLALPIRESVTVILTTPTGRVLSTESKVIDVDPVIINHKRTHYDVELRSGDPLLYDYTNGSALQVTIDKAKAGGFTLPVKFPIKFRGGSLPSAVENTGTVTVKPIITLTGSAINPVITNVTTGQFIKLNLTMVASDTVVIDTAKQTVTLNGGNIRNSVDPLSKFWNLPPGINQIKLESTSQTDTVHADIKWFNGFLSI